VVLTGVVDAVDLLPADTDPAEVPFEAGPGIALGDLDGDGWPEATVAVPLGASVVLGNDGRGNLLPDPAWTADGGPLPTASAVAAADLDGDGDLDLVLSRRSGLPDLVLRNEGTRDLRSEVLPDSEPESLTITVADLDGDGRLDLFLAGFQDPESREREHSGPSELRGEGQRLYLQTGSGTFERALDALPEAVEPALTFHAATLDADGDGDLDLYLANDFVAQAVPNTLLLNDGEARFEVAEHAACEVGVNPMGAGVGDVDGDGRLDLYVSDVDTQHVLLGGADGVFVSSGRALGAVVTDSMPTWGAAVVDLDLDGRSDLVAARGGIPPEGVVPDVSQADGGLLLRQTPGGYQDLGAGGDYDLERQGRSVVIGDLDRDGRPELVTAGLWSVETWDLDGGCTGFALRFEGAPAIGARVEVELSDRVHTSWLLPSTTFSMSEQVLMVGLGGAAVAERVVVTWPDGEQEVLEDVPAGSQLVLARER